MKPFWKRRPRPAAVQREHAEKGADTVHAEVVIPLQKLRIEIQKMRSADYLPTAVLKDMLREREGEGERGPGRPDRD